MDHWVNLGYMLAGILLNSLTYVAIVRRARKNEQIEARRDIKRRGEEALQFDLMWRDYRKRHNMNGGTEGV